MAKVIEGEQQQNKDDDKEPLSCFQRYLRGPGPAYSLVFVDFFGCALPEPSVIPDPLTGIFWLCILVFILVPTWQTK